MCKTPPTWRNRSHIEGEPGQARPNEKKHGVTFERAASIFLDPQALSLFDEEHGQGEDRWISLGLDRTGVLLVVCHTYREETEPLARIRIISGRKPTKNEAKHYGRD